MAAHQQGQVCLPRAALPAGLVIQTLFMVCRGKWALHSMGETSRAYRSPSFSAEQKEHEGPLQLEMLSLRLPLVRGHQAIMRLTAEVPLLF